MKKIIIASIISAVIFSSITAFAITSYNSNQVLYKKGNEDITVTEALDELYANTNGGITIPKVWDGTISDGGYWYYKLSTPALTGIYLVVRSMNYSDNCNWNPSITSAENFRIAQKVYTPNNDWMEAYIVKCDNTIITTEAQAASGRINSISLSYVKISD